MPSFLDLSGKTFSRLTAISRDASKVSRVHWLCKCSCGRSCVIASSKLINGHTQSCGCLHVERSSSANMKHGQSSYPNSGNSTKEYNTWAMMKRRCTNKTSADYMIYGGRGIKVCDRWLTFELFFMDMGAAPSAHHSIDRIDGNGPYSPENCRWADTKTQGRNRSITEFLEYNGERLPIGAWSEKTGIPYKRIHARLSRGWTIAKALTTPMP